LYHPSADIRPAGVYITIFTQISAYLIFRVSGAALIQGRRLFNLLTETFTGKRKRKVGLVVVYSLHARSEECEDFEERTE